MRAFGRHPIGHLDIYFFDLHRFGGGGGGGGGGGDSSGGVVAVALVVVNSSILVFIEKT